MKKDILKVTVKDGCEQAFEDYCKDNNILCRQYNEDTLKTRYRAECKEEQLKGADKFIKRVIDMPMVSTSW